MERNREEGGEDGVLTNLGEGDASLLVNTKDFMEEIFHLVCAAIYVSLFCVCHCLPVTELVCLPSELIALVLETPDGVELCITALLLNGNSMFIMK
jgi:hypothetical protein